jgi:hypothetical protein
MFPEKTKKKQVSKLKIIIITCKNCLNTAYHALLSFAIHELSQPFLTVITLHVILYKKLHLSWFMSKSHGLQKKLLLIKIFHIKQ